MSFYLLSTFGLARLELYRGEIGIPCDNDHCNVDDEGDIDIKVTLTILVMMIMNIVIIKMMIMTMMRIMARGVGGPKNGKEDTYCWRGLLSAS